MTKLGSSASITCRYDSFSLTVKQLCVHFLCMCCLSVFDSWLILVCTGKYVTYLWFGPTFPWISRPLQTTHQWCHISEDLMRFLEMRVQNDVGISADLYHWNQLSVKPQKSRLLQFCGTTAIQFSKIFKVLDSGSFGDPLLWWAGACMVMLILDYNHVRL